MPGVRRSDISVGMGELVVHRARVADWEREVLFLRGGGDAGGRLVDVRFRPIDVASELEITFEASLASFPEAVAAVAAFLNLPFDRWPGPRDYELREPGPGPDEPFLAALKRNVVALPDGAVFRLATGWLSTGRRESNWVHAYLPFPSRYPYRDT